jgi:hypothetical protein
MMEKLEILRGLVRPVISILLVLVACYLGIMGKIPPEQFITIVAMVISFHFGERAAKKKEAPPTD